MCCARKPEIQPGIAQSVRRRQEGASSPRDGREGRACCHFHPDSGPPGLREDMSVVFGRPTLWPGAGLALGHEDRGRMTRGVKKAAGEGRLTPAWQEQVHVDGTLGVLCRSVQEDRQSQQAAGGGRPEVQY